VAKESPVNGADAQGIVDFEPRRKRLGYGKEPARASIPRVAVYSLSQLVVVLEM
jgi:hypothetical protein